MNNKKELKEKCQLLAALVSVVSARAESGGSPLCDAACEVLAEAEILKELACQKPQNP